MKTLVVGTVESSYRAYKVTFQGIEKLGPEPV